MNHNVYSTGNLLDTRLGAILVYIKVRVYIYMYKLDKMLEYHVTYCTSLKYSNSLCIIFWFEVETERCARQHPCFTFKTVIDRIERLREAPVSLICMNEIFRHRIFVTSMHRRRNGLQANACGPHATLWLSSYICMKQKDFVIEEGLLLSSIHLLT